MSSSLLQYSMLYSIFTLFIIYVLLFLLKTREHIQFISGSCLEPKLRHALTDIVLNCFKDIELCHTYAHGFILWYNPITLINWFLNMTTTITRFTVHHYYLCPEFISLPFQDWYILIMSGDYVIDNDLFSVFWLFDSITVSCHILYCKYYVTTSHCQWHIVSTHN